MVAAEARSKELQEELTATYKEKSRLAEELVQASRQLQIVRDSNEAQVTQRHPTSQRPMIHEGAMSSGSLGIPGHFWGLQGPIRQMKPCLRAGSPYLLVFGVSAAAV